MDTELILKAIDIGGWKHSQHLPKLVGTNWINWNDPETIRKCQDAIESLTEATLKELMLLQSARKELPQRSK